ncbi:aminodeoxychorismate lyase [Thalassotalea sp. LPB0316]|uniref:aminodeoxychorismate lyase n=1 Tax=Thalassotalea sp. LPB0316 TaxID=2769490 RepID=UPI001867A31C|nr:aminodeoxychorismate lyase [Thalassotalea sp. LPB0316]QOL24809.1 aminodeoxychorismate lyase [Thalassotalea sp. LPB0316]
MLFCSINGQPTHQLPISDRTIHYGDGIFTTAKIGNGQIVWLEQHLERLKQASKVLAIEGVDWQALKSEMITIAKDYSIAVLKVIISAGHDSKAYARADNCRANTIILVNAFPMHYEKWQQRGIRLGIAETRLGINSTLAGIKHLNRLEQVLLKNEHQQRDFDYLIALNEVGHVIESTSSNLFVLIGKTWHTPKLSQSGVDGLARQKLISAFDKIVVGTVSVEDLHEAKAMLLTNCLMPAIPVVQFQDVLLPIEPCVPLISYLNEAS